MVVPAMGYSAGDFCLGVGIVGGCGYVFRFWLPGLWPGNVSHTIVVILLCHKLTLFDVIICCSFTPFLIPLLHVGNAQSTPPLTQQCPL